MAAYSQLDLILTAVAAFALGALAVGAFAVRLLLRRIEWFQELLNELDVQNGRAKARADELDERFSRP